MHLPRSSTMAPTIYTIVYRKQGVMSTQKFVDARRDATKQMKKHILKY